MPSALGSVADRIAEVVGVEEVEYLPAHLDVGRARDLEALGRQEVHLPEGRTAQGAALQVAELSRRRDAERRRIQPLHAVLQIRINARNQFGRRTLRDAPPPGVLMIAVRPAAALPNTFPAASM